MFEENTNYDLFRKLHPRSFSEALVAKYAKSELENRAANGDGEAKMLLAIRESELREENRSIRPAARQKPRVASPVTFIFRMRLT